MIGMIRVKLDDTLVLMDATLAELKTRAIARIDELSGRLAELAVDIHAHPELAFQEHRSAGLLVEALRREGFDVSEGTGGLETAFQAEHGAGRRPRLAVLAEYDALPEIGHACGHNLICTAALGAGLAVRAAAPDLPGRLLVLGTPAEEGGGGKVLMARAGVFADVDAAMMFHPSTKTMVNRPSKAMVRVTVEFHGKAAHASSAPDMGINALEAMIQTFVLVNGLRQHLRRDAVLHGVITDGGRAANVIPAYTSAQFSVRGNDFRYRDELVDRLRRCVEAAALATGCRGELTPGMSYDNIVSNQTLAAAFERNLQQLGVATQAATDNERTGSTDMGDISQILPSIHPYLAIAPETVAGHTTDFAAAAASDVGREAMLNAAKAMAMTCLDLFYRPDLLEQASVEFQEQLRAGRVRGGVS
jgi:amidohydrolase